MAEPVYVLCAVTSFACAILLFRGYRSTGKRLLFWSGVCFVGLTINNAVLVTDLVLLPAVDLSFARNAIALGAMGTLLFGLIWDSR